MSDNLRINPSLLLWITKSMSFIKGAWFGDDNSKIKLFLSASKPVPRIRNFREVSYIVCISGDITTSPNTAPIKQKTKRKIETFI